MIKSFKHKGLKLFYDTSSTAGIQAKHATRLQRILTLLDKAMTTTDMDMPTLNLHELKGQRKGDFSVTVQANWRVTFRFIEGGVELVNYEDYH
ncbi:MAG: type II toxin-antitoxin system RelE/ParE family toxin [Agitococcus sp.]|nr:type II toxin-antitoxin system RelE/ParE family toxin [Agitococcus sp.]